MKTSSFEMTFQDAISSGFQSRLVYKVFYSEGDHPNLNTSNYCSIRDGHGNHVLNLNAKLHRFVLFLGARFTVNCKQGTRM